MTFFSDWASIVASYFQTAAGALTLDFGLTTSLAALGTLLGLVGAVLALLWREVKALWMVLLICLATLSPFILTTAYDILAMVGVAFLILMTVVLLPLVFSLIARDATKRLPIWLLAGFVVSLLIVCGVSPVPSSLPDPVVTETAADA